MKLVFSFVFKFKSNLIQQEHTCFISTSNFVSIKLFGSNKSILIVDMILYSALRMNENENTKQTSWSKPTQYMYNIRETGDHSRSSIKYN